MARWHDGLRARKAGRALLLGLLLPSGPLAILPSAVEAIDSKAGTGGGAFLKIGAGSPRAAALGKAFAALSEGSDAMLYNPAGLAVGTQREVAFTVTDWAQGVHANSLGYAHPVGRSVLGAHASYLSVSGFDVRDEQGLALAGTHVRVRDAVGTVSVAHSFLYEKLFLGLSVKEVYENNGGPKKSTVVEDLGAIVRPNPKIAVGAVFQNLSNDKKRVAQTHRLGLALSPSAFLNLMAELSKDSDNSSRAGLGVELVLPEEMLQVGRVALRAGFFETDGQGENRGDRLVKRLSLQRTSGVSFGLGLYSAELTGYGIGLDYALVPLGALGASHQIQVRLTF